MTMKSYTKRRRHTALLLILLHQFLFYSYSFSFRPSNVLISQAIGTAGNDINSRCTSSSSSVVANKVSSFRLNRHSRLPFITRRLHSTNGDDNNATSESNRGNDESTSSSSETTSPSKLKDLYGILDADPTMTKSQIKQRYLSLAKRSHPDSAAYDPALSFNEISAAYQTLSDDKSRKRYDRQVAAEEFKGDVVAYASEVAKEYGPVARKLYDEWALPWIKRTTAGTVAGLSVLGSGGIDIDGNDYENANNDGSSNDKASDCDDGSSVAERTRSMGSVKKPMESSPVREKRQTATINGKNNNRGSLRDFGKAFVRVIEASRNATRQIDGAELQEKSDELRQRADEARAESLLILEQLTSIQNERLRLTFHTPHVEFTSEEALKFLNEFQNNIQQQGDGTNNNGSGDDDSETMGIMGRMGFKHTLREDIDMFRVAEEEFRSKLQEKQDVDYKQDSIAKELERAEQNTRDAEMELIEAKKRLEQAQEQLLAYQSKVTEVQRNISNMNVSVKRADQELSRSDQHLKRKRDVVRRALKRKDDMYNGDLINISTFDNNARNVNDTTGNNNYASTNDMEYDSENMFAQIDKLREEEAGMESEFLMLVEKASRLVSRSERLRIRSEALIGKQQQQQQQQQQNDEIIMELVDTDDEVFASNGGTVVEDSFSGTI